MVIIEKKGQSAIEYVIIWTTLIASILAASQMYLKPAVESVLIKASEKIEAEVQNLLEGLGKAK